MLLPECVACKAMKWRNIKQDQVSSLLQSVSPAKEEIHGSTKLPRLLTPQIERDTV